MFKKKSLLKMGNFSHSFGQGGPLSEDHRAENEDDLLIEALLQFASENHSSWDNDQPVMVDDKSYFMILNFDKSPMTLKQFIHEYYPRGSTLIFEKGFVSYIAVRVCKNGLKVAIIDANVYLSYKLHGTILSFDKETNQIIKKPKDWQVFNSGDTSTDCGSF